MRVVLVNPYARSLSWFFYSQGMVTPPFGMVQVATCLRDDGHDVRVIDGQANYEDQEITLQRVLARDPEMIGIGTTPLVHLYSFMSTTATPYWLDFARRLRGAGYPGRILVGGTYASRFPAETLAACDAVDGVVLGEGDVSMVEFARRPSESVPGIVTRTHPNPGSAGPAPPACDPDFSLLEEWPGSYGVDESLCLGEGPRRLRLVTPVLTARGCPFRCTFCPTPVFFDKRFSEAEPRAGLGSLARVTGAVSVWDDTFTVSPQRVEAICDGLIGRGSPATWWCFGRSEWILRNRHLLPKMRRAGLRMMWLGVESTEAGALKDYARPTPFDQSKAAVRILVEEGILPTTSYIVGHPEITRAGLRAEHERSEETFALGSVNVYTIMIPLPGTPMHARLQAEDRLVSTDLRLYGGTRAVVRYRHVEAAEVEDHFYEAYAGSILSERFLTHVGRANLWSQATETRARNLRVEFEAERDRARTLELT